MGWVTCDCDLGYYRSAGKQLGGAFVCKVKPGHCAWGSEKGEKGDQQASRPKLESSHHPQKSRRAQEGRPRVVGRSLKIKDEVAEVGQSQGRARSGNCKEVAVKKASTQEVYQGA